MFNEKSKITDLSLLSQTIDLMNKGTDFQIISEIIFNFIKHFVNYNMVVIYKLNEKSGILEMVSCLGTDVEKLKKRMPFKIGEGAVGLVAMNKKPLLIKDVLKNKEKITVRQYYGEDPIIRSFLAVPLIVEDKVIGILSVSCSNPHEYDEYDVHMINIIASQGALLLKLNTNIIEARNLSNQIIENVNSGVIVINENYEVVEFNKAAEKITGFTYNEIRNKKIINTPYKIKEIDLLIIKSMSEDKQYFEEPINLIRKDGKELKVRLSTSLIYNDKNDVKSCICIFRDNTEIEILQRKIAIADKLNALGRLTSGITHEIRNPLLPIRNASNYLLNKFKQNNNDEEIVKLLSIIAEESDRLNNFLEQLLRLNKDNLFSFGECDLKEILEETLILLNYVIKQNNIDLKLNLVECKIIVLLNKDNLKQIFLNLLLNAIDAINMSNNVKRTLEINTKIQDNFLVVEIIDTGIGISKENIDKIFDPFYTTKESGTGIGLPIILNIINNSNGMILIDSTEGNGTKVTLKLPLAKGWSEDND